MSLLEEKVRMPFIMAEPVDILVYPHPLLRQKAERIDIIGPEINTIAQRMLVTMLSAPGYGLAANQIGVLKRMVTVNPGSLLEDDGMKPFVMINPQVVKAGQERVREEEGCLSLPAMYGYLNRPEFVVIEFQDLEGKRIVMEAEGYYARCLLHEIDHLDGILFWDRLDSSARKYMKLKYYLGY